MNTDFILNALKQFVTMLAGIGVGFSLLSAEQAKTLISDVSVAVPALIGIGSMLWSIYSHWDMKKVPETAVAVQLPKSVPVPPVGGTIDLTAAKGTAKVVG